MSSKNKTDPAVAERAASLQALGLDSRLALTTAAAKKTTNLLLSALTQAGLSASAPDETKANLVHVAITKMGPTVGTTGRDMLLSAIQDGRVGDVPHVEAAAAWLSRQYKSGGGGGLADAQLKQDAFMISEEEFNIAAGVGVVVTADDTELEVSRAVDGVKVELLEKRYRYNVGLLQKTVMETLRFADGKLVNELLRRKVEDLLGPKTEEDMAKPKKAKKVKAANKDACGAGGNKSKPNGVPAANGTAEEIADPFESVPSRFEARGLASAENTPELLAKQREMSGGKVVTRFPPEPNGYLHVGHSKAMFIDFGYAKKMGGNCILRFDDTNPIVEKTEYTDAIREMVAWMGHEPLKVTYSSEYFDELYALALELIRRGKAYVCHQTGDEISRDRKEGVDSPWRGRSVDENLRLFDDMRKGKYDEGAATLRMKIDMQHANLAMRDPIAYRILYAPHPHIGDRWCIYPSYDYTHCIVDSLEWVTHSLCTLEFEIRRDSYYWLLEALDLYRPFVWESARLNLEHTVMSKRKLKQLVEQHIVRGWDDPRMPTLVGMRRRGYTPEALNKFCAAIGVSRNANMIGMHVLEYWVRFEHDANARRVMAVLHPLKVTISNFKADGNDTGTHACTAPNHPKLASMGERCIQLTNTVYIERSDFRAVDQKNYYGLAPGKTAMLRYAFPVTVTDVVWKDDGKTEPLELIVEMDYAKTVKPKGVLHWVPQHAHPFQARMYSTLFKSPDPSALKDDWLKDINEDSEIVIDGCLIEDSAKQLKSGTTVQFERTGYFTVDQDTTPERMVFNKTVSLRDSR